MTTNQFTNLLVETLSIAESLEINPGGLMMKRHSAGVNMYGFRTPDGKIAVAYLEAECSPSQAQNLHRRINRKIVADGRIYCIISCTTGFGR